MNIALPFLSSLLSFLFAAMVGDQWLRRRQPYQLVWTIGLLSSPGLTGMFREQADYFASLHGPPDPAVLLDISLRYGVRPVEGPPLVRGPQTTPTTTS